MKTQMISVMHSIEREEFFFTEKHGMTEELKNKLPGNDWCAISYTIPMNVAPRKGLENGFIDSVEKLIFVFHKNDKLITSLSEIKTINTTITEQYATFTLAGEKRSGLIVKINNSTIYIKPVIFDSPRIPFYKTPMRLQSQIKRHLKKHQVRIYPVGVRPVL